MKQLCFLMLVLTLSLAAQMPYQETYEKEFFRGKYPQKVPVLFRAYPTAQGEQQYRVHILAEIKYAYMQFVYQQDHYSAGAEIEAVFQEAGSGKSVTKIWRTQFQAPDYETTQDGGRFHFTVDSISLAAGKYQILFKYRDLNGQRRLNFSQKLTLPEPGNVYAAMPLFEYLDDPTRPAVAHLGGVPSALQLNWDFNRDLGVFLQVWRKDPALAVKTRLEVVDAESNKTVFELDSTLANQQARQTLNLAVPANLFQERSYRLRVDYWYEGDSTHHVIPLNVIWFSKPVSLWDYQMAVEPMIYLMDEAAYKELTRGNAEEKRRKFREYWESRDPSPDTPFNELEKEFYTRVDSAVVRFSSKGIIGWKTDLGKIYISNGPPDQIEDHSLDPVPNPFLRWIYFQDGKRLTYTFIPLDGRKEYKLSEAVESTL